MNPVTPTWVMAFAWGDALLGALAVVAVAGVVRLLLGPAARRTTAGEPLEGVLGRLARPVPIDEALQQVVDALRQAPGHRSVEVWQRRGDELVLTHSAPLVDRSPTEVHPAAVRVAVGVGVVGDTWLGTWFPGLTADTPGVDRTRAVPLATRSELAGAVLLRRQPGAPAFGAADDDRLLRLQRPLAAALNQERLTAALRRNVEELERRNQELQASRARLVSVADAERRRLERDLHDGAQARLTALAVRLQLVRRLTEADPSRVDELLGTIESELVDAAAELRALAHGIMPPLLLTGGLGDALRGAASRAPIEVHVDVPGSDRYRPEVEAAVYYCCVEAIQNTVKHAGPSATATVEVRHEGDRLAFTVCDDGRGLGAQPAAAGHGLLNMSDRIGALGGTVTVGPGPSGVGVAVAGQVPLDVAAR